MSSELELAASLGAITNLVHGFIYFAPEAATEYAALGLAPEHQYFASRAAPMGPVPAEVVIATFFNFNPEMVRHAIPAAWESASPAAIQDARMRAASAVLARCCASVEAAAVAEAGELAAAMLAPLGYEGKPLAGANRAVSEPDDPWALLWQRITILREWRGDVHVAALTAAPVDAVEALILHAATDQVPRATLVSTRQWPDDRWAAGVARLRSRGLVDAEERFTDEGRAFRDDIEHRTNVACIPMVDAVGVDEARRFVELLKPIRRGLLDGGAFAMMGR
ncbi:MAG: hypothetical protein R2707_05205 [Acidimicrobiales bacterium]